MKRVWHAVPPLRTAVAAALMAVLLAVSGIAQAGPYAAILVNSANGEVIYGIDADQPRYPASLTKMMTLYMAFEALDAGRIGASDRIRVSYHAASQPPSKLGLDPGDEISVENAILALVTKSANDAAAALAEHIAGSESTFADRMTARAHALGMTSSYFRNASGLPDTGQITTARDMATLGLALLHRFPHYYPYFSTGSFQYGGVSHRNHNRMLTTYDGVDGIKTGFINASGFNLVASAKRDNRRLVGVVFGARSSAERARIMTALLDGGFEALNTGTFVEAALVKAPAAMAAAAVAPSKKSNRPAAGPAVVGTAKVKTVVAKSAAQAKSATLAKSTAARKPAAERATAGARTKDKPLTLASLAARGAAPSPAGKLMVIGATKAPAKIKTGTAVAAKANAATITSTKAKAQAVTKTAPRSKPAGKGVDKQQASKACPKAAVKAAACRDGRAASGAG